MPISNQEALNDYAKALKQGRREGGHLLVLDDILKEKHITAPREVPLGLVQIPMDQIVGTKTEGRSNAFSSGFSPMLKETSEFGMKWMELYKAHLEEGIRDPIKAYEFMNKFYVLEGNKRVSVLKFFGAVSIPGTVTRVIPPLSDDEEVKIYYEFMDFYNLSGINFIYFSQEGSFAKLQRLVGKRPDEVWDDDDRLLFSSVYNRFTAEYEAKGGEKLTNITTGDAFLSFINLYGYKELDAMTATELKDLLKKSWGEYKLLTNDESLELQMNPTDEKPAQKSFLSRLIPAGSPVQRVAFVHEKTAETSAWTYAHELGRMHLQQTFNDQIETNYYYNATEENADNIIQCAIEDGNDLIFTTTPPLMKASLKAAIAHPELKILNCSLNTSHRYIRTYYARMYEGKFLMGAIAGAMAENDKVGYIADYPIFGMTANINAFALGARMVNPRAKVYLEWSTLKNHDVKEQFKKNDVQYISGQDMIIPGEASRHFGLYKADEETTHNIAMPLWHWGKFYEQMIRNIMSGSWKSEDTRGENKGLNYWWGMSAGIVDVITSTHLPLGTQRLVKLLKQTITGCDFNPFTGVIYDQDGNVHNSEDKTMNPEEIITMDWLVENIIGEIPKMDDLIDKAKPVVSLSGLDNTEA